MYYDESLYPSISPIMRELSTGDWDWLMKKTPNGRIKQVIFNPPATIILWDNGTKTVVKCCEGDEYDAEKGFYAAYLKGMIGDKKFNRDRHKWVKEEKPYKTKPPFNVGDKVKIVDHRNDWWVSDMEAYMGKIMTIKSVDADDDDGSFTLEGADGPCWPWYWGEEDFARE